MKVPARVFNVACNLLIFSNVAKPLETTVLVTATLQNPVATRITGVTRSPDSVVIGVEVQREMAGTGRQQLLPWPS